MNNIKQLLFEACSSFVETRYQIIENTITEIQESMLSETKSTAGDKHETGRAMLQLEREKAGNQLVEIEKLKRILSKINNENNSKTIGLSSVVYTTQKNYYIAISAGELKLENDAFYAISLNTPIAQLLNGKTVGDEIAFRNQHFKVTKIL